MPTDQDIQSGFRFFGIKGDKEVMQFALRNQHGVQVNIINYGAAITNIFVPDKNGIMEDVVLGFDNLDGYLQKGNRFFGALVGRYANRIANGRFSINGIPYQVTKNRGDHSIHGGTIGFDKVIWEVVETNDSDSLTLSYKSKDGEEGYPGNLKVSVSYTLSEDNSLKIEYRATTDQPTIINLTNHSYFNLSPSKDMSILDHELMINADFYAEVNDELIPSGNLVNVKNGPLDFKAPKLIRKDISKLASGYDHNMVLNKSAGEISQAATVYHPTNGRCMEVFTDQPGLQFYSGNFLDGSLIGKGSVRYGKYSGLCLETQHYPDSPNHSHFPSTILLPNQTYNHITSYNFSVR
jgi:aldose 1-epimerase